MLGFFARTTCIVLAIQAASPASAVEGPTAAGPIGGTDIGSAVLPPPGLYGGLVGLGVETRRFVDQHGDTVAALSQSNLSKVAGGPWLLYVSSLEVLGGTVGIGAVVPSANQCGHLFAGEPNHCITGIGDPYVEIDWSRTFGKLRASEFAGARPILEGFSVLVGIGVVLPLGQYDPSTPTSKALSAGTNIWDVAPSIAVTYTTPAIFFEGTEFSAKLFWNNYQTNPETDYLAGDLLDVDFAITEHIGRVQVGLAGAYAFQIADDRVSGMTVPPNGNRGELLQLGCVLNYDLPEFASVLKFKASTSVVARNTVEYSALVVGWAKKF